MIASGTSVAVMSRPASRARSWLLLAVLLLALSAVIAVWLSIDRRPQQWDHANHLKRAVDCYRTLSEPGHDRLKEILETSSFYPPIAPCAAGVLYFVFPIVPLTAQSVMLAFLALGVATTFALGRRLLDEPAGLLAAFFVATAPFVVFSLTNFQLDLPLMAVVALALYALVRTEEFSRPGWSVGCGLTLALGMLTKPPFAVYLLPPLLWTAWRAVLTRDRRRRLGLLLLALLIGGAVALPWYGPRLLGLPMQISERSFKQAAEEGKAEALTAEGLLYYPRTFPSQVGMLVGPLFVWGLVALRKERARAFLWLAALGPLVVFSLIQNKNLRYTLPILPAIALVTAVGVRALPPVGRRVAVALCLIAGVLQVSMTAFTVPMPPRVPGLLLPLVLPWPPDRADWQHAKILADLERESGGRPATVSVVPNDNFFSVSNFRYEAAVRQLPLKMIRPWADTPLDVDFAILKTGSQGPSYMVAKSEAINRAFANDRYLAEIFPIVAEYPLPDGSRGILRARRIQPLAGVAPAELARRLEASPAQLLAGNVRDPVGLRLQTHYQPDAILRGQVERVVIEADSAVVGELKRRDRAPLRIRDTRLEVEGLLMNPRRLLETGQLEVLDVKALRVRHLVVTEDDLRELLRGQPPGGVSVRLGAGSADVQVDRIGPELYARVQLASGRGGSPFTLIADRVRVGRLPIPDALIDWIVRQFDPTLALRKLPIEVSLAPIRIEPGRIVIGQP
ncbi:MAG TPA: LmeA family phospholipid-binding protein [Methylomirabilota bacterium]|nr:LmeA family phospholipid-binding protein [Methylomirabilota bacterium]